MKLFWFLLVLWQLAANDADDSHKRVLRQTVANCRSPYGEDGLCINIRQCKSLLQMMIEDGKDARIVTFLRNSKCGTDGRDPKVCCPEALDESRSLIPEATTAIAGPKLTEPPKASSNNNQKNQPIQCGVSTLESDRVVGGVDARLGSWPWIVGLSYKIRGAVKAPLDIKCGATLISNQWVITAAHCLSGSAVKDMELAFARLGDLDMDDKVNDGANPIDAAIDQIIIHPQYSNVVKQNDIALLHLKEPVALTQNLHQICLLSGPTYKTDQYYATKLPYIIGWGATGWLGKSSTKLQEAQVKIIPPAKCEEQYSKVKGAVINEKVLCAGDIGKDTCQGDSGGPLIFIDRKISYLGGIVSYGIGCNTSFPGVYTKIAEYIDWINENTGEKVLK